MHEQMRSLNRARKAVGRKPLTAAFHMSPEELSKKAKEQNRNDEGQFEEEIAVKARLPEIQPPPPQEPEGAGQGAGVSETIPAGEVFPDDVIGLTGPGGERFVVDDVQTQDEGGRQRTSIFGREVGDEVSRLVGVFDADERLPLFVDDLQPQEQGWRADYEEARSRLPEDMNLFGQKQIGPDYVPPTFQRVLDKVHAARDAYAGGDRSEATMAELRGRVDGLEGMTPEEGLAAVDVEVASLEDFVKETTAGMYEGLDHIPDQGADAKGNTIPGAIADEHLGALLEMGQILNDELERRIQEAMPQMPATVVDAMVDREVARQRMADLQVAHDTVQADKQQQAFEAEWARQRVAGTRRRAFTDAQEVYRVASGFQRSSRERQEFAAEMWQQMQATLDADPQMTQARTQLTEARDEWSRADRVVREVGQIENYGGGETGRGSDTYARVQREQAVGLIAEIRGMGKVIPMEVNSTGRNRAEIERSLEYALGVLPADWVDDIEAQDLLVGLTRRGNYRKPRTDRRGELLLSTEGHGAGDTVHGRVAVHELGHAVEDSRRHIRTAQWAYSHRRAPRADSEQRDIGGRMRGEMAFFDRWANAYTGKVYLDSDLMAWEIFTTGIESLMAGSGYFLRKAEEGGFDEEFRAFILALLAAG